MGRRVRFLHWFVFSLCLICLLFVFYIEERYVVEEWKSLRAESLNLNLDFNSTTAPMNYKISRRIKQLPHALIIGTMKGGTSTLERYLNFHPDIAARMVELNFFNNDLYFNQGPEWYLSRLPFSYPDQIVIEKSPAYLQHTLVVPQRVYHLNSSMKLIAILVDPLKRTVSHYAHRMAHTTGNLLSLAKSVYLKGSSRINQNSLLVNTSMYHDRIIDWLQWFPQKQFLFLSGEEFKTKPWIPLRQCEKFLGLRSFYKKSNFYYNETKGFFCFNGTESHCMSNNKGRKHPFLDRDVLVKLQNFYNAENQKLYKLLGRDFRWPTTVPENNGTEITI